MKQNDDSSFFEEDPEENDPLGANAQVRQEIREAYEKRVREYAVQHGSLEEDEIDALFPKFEDLETFVRDVDKLRRKARREAAIVEDDEEEDGGSEEVSVKDNTKLSGTDKDLGELRMKESAVIKGNSTKSLQMKEKKARSSAFKDLPPEDRPSADQYSQMLELMREASEEAETGDSE